MSDGEKNFQSSLCLCLSSLQFGSWVLSLGTKGLPETEEDDERRSGDVVSNGCQNPLPSPRDGYLFPSCVSSFLSTPPPRNHDLPFSRPPFPLYTKKESWVEYFICRRCITLTSFSSLSDFYFIWKKDSDSLRSLTLKEERENREWGICSQ